MATYCGAVARSEQGESPLLPDWNAPNLTRRMGQSRQQMPLPFLRPAERSRERAARAGAAAGSSRRGTVSRKQRSEQAQQAPKKQLQGIKLQGR